MNAVEFEDVTHLINDFTKGTVLVKANGANRVADMKPDQLVHSEKFTLYDSMSSIEIMDPKMDFKSNLKPEDTIQDLINKKKIKLPEELTVKEVTAHIDLFPTSHTIESSTEFLMRSWAKRCYG